MGQAGGFLEMTLACPHRLFRERQLLNKVTIQPKWGSKLPLYSKPGQGGTIPTTHSLHPAAERRVPDCQPEQNLGTRDAWGGKRSLLPHPAWKEGARDAVRMAGGAQRQLFTY